MKMKEANLPVSSTAPPTKKHITEQELEDTYGIPVKTLQKWRLVGRGPRARKFGRSVRYSVVDVDAWISTLPVIGGQLQAKN
jgi:predicted DNA-binding transcriptional regulator AlpA